MNKKAFQAGFLAGLADQGYTPSDLEARMEKSAVVGWVLPLAAAGGLAALGATRLLGRGVGMAAQKFTEPTEQDLSIAKKQEELEEYRRLIEEAKLRAAEQTAVQIPGTV